VFAIFVFNKDSRFEERKLNFFLTKLVWINFVCLNEICKIHNIPAFYWVDKNLSVSNLSMDRPIMSLYTDMLAIWNRSNKKVWAFKRRLAYFKKNCEMQSVGWPWARPGSINFCEKPFIIS